MEFLTRSASVRDRIRVWRAAGARDYEALQRRGTESLAAAGLTSEYCVIRRAADLAAVRGGTRDLVILAAARLGARRLIDNSRVRLIDRY